MTVYGSSPSGATMILTEKVAGFDSANIVANSSVDTTVLFPGADVGDIVQISPVSAALEAGLTIQGRVGTQGILTIRVTNATTAAVNPAAIDLNVALIRP